MSVPCKSQSDQLSNVSRPSHRSAPSGAASVADSSHGVSVSIVIDGAALARDLRQQGEVFARQQDGDT